jgi:glutaconate CoA-transferase subunit A
MGPAFLPSPAALAARIPEGALIALPPDYSLSPVRLIAALIRQGTKRLRLFCLPVGGFLADLLIGAGLVETIETSAVSLGEFGPAPRFLAALREGAITLRDATCPALHTALQAAEKGVPFMPLRGLLGSDILAHRPDWRVIGNPFAEEGEEDPIVLIPALRPDFALFHAALADREGNVWVGRRRELATLAHAARDSLVTVERIVEHSLLEDETMAPGLITAPYVTAIAEAPRGADPLGLLDLYPPEPGSLAAYAKAARTAEGFRSFLADFLAPAAP